MLQLKQQIERRARNPRAAWCIRCRKPQWWTKVTIKKTARFYRQLFLVSVPFLFVILLRDSIFVLAISHWLGQGKCFPCAFLLPLIIYFFGFNCYVRIWDVLIPGILEGTIAYGCCRWGLSLRCTYLFRRRCGARSILRGEFRNWSHFYVRCSAIACVSRTNKKIYISFLAIWTLIKRFVLEGRDCWHRCSKALQVILRMFWLCNWETKCRITNNCDEMATCG